MDICSLCGGDIEGPEIYLEKTYTLYSKSLLSVFLQKCVKEEVLISNYLICKICYLLVNELDRLKVRSLEIEHQLNEYLNKYVSQKQKTEYVDGLNIKGENNICNQESHLKEDKSNLKADNNGDTNEIGDNLEQLQMIPIFNQNSLLPVLNSSIDFEKIEIKTEDNKSNGKPFHCSECSKTWKTSTELKNHLLSHSQDRPFVCEICGQSYKRQQALSVHIGMHKGINPFTCVYCQKSFTQKGALVRHMPIHTGDWPFQCDLCGKRFVHHTSFNMHKLTHSGEKSFKCDRCGLLLMSGSHLKRHMRVHTGEKKYGCCTCGKKFAERYNLVVHERLHLGQSEQKKHKCQICDNVYRHRNKLKKHLLAHHQSVQSLDDEKIDMMGKMIR